jgi:hypothetical protein
MYGMNAEQKAQFEAQKQKLEKMKVEAENLMKRLRGEEVESDKEVEGDLDLVPAKFETEHGLPPERVDELVELLLAVAEDMESDALPRRAQPIPEPAVVGPNGMEQPETAEEYIAYLRKRGLWR